MTTLKERPREEIERIFRSAPFIDKLGLRLVSIEAGACVSALELQAWHLQQDGFVHAGVQATMADHTAGAAAATVAAPGSVVLTVEFKINLLRAARGQRLECCAAVLKPGARLTVVESEIFCDENDARVLVSKTTASMAVLDPR